MNGFKKLIYEENKLYYIDGIKDGLLLRKQRSKFLKKTTLSMMKKKKYKEEYKRLFNGF